MAMSRLLTAKEVARLFNTSEARVQDLARQGLLPSISLGRQRRFDSAKLERWLDEGGQALPGGWRQEPSETTAS